MSLPVITPRSSADQGRRSAAGDRLLVELSAVTLPFDGTGGDLLERPESGPGHVALCVADAMGKGRSAAIVADHVRDCIRAAVAEGRSPALVAERANRLLRLRLTTGQFATAFFLRIDRARGRLEYTRCGHPPALLVRRDGRVRRLTEGGGILGAFPEFHFRQGGLDLAAGDRLLLYTDGLSEAGQETGHELGERRLAALLSRCRHLEADALRQEVQEALARHVGGGRTDDVTIGVLAVSAAARAADRQTFPPTSA